MRDLIKSFDYSDTITKQNEMDAIRRIDNLFHSDNWCKSVPHFQTWPNLFLYEELTIFTNCFVDACRKYGMENYKHIKLWCYVDFLSNKKDRDRMWHNHGNAGLSGVYYLSNPDNVYTEFETVILKDVKPFFWHIFPSNLMHRPPETMTNEKRYTLAADYVVV